MNKLFLILITFLIMSCSENILSPEPDIYIPVAKDSTEFLMILDYLDGAVFHTDRTLQGYSTIDSIYFVLENPTLTDSTTATIIITKTGQVSQVYNFPIKNDYAVYPIGYNSSSLKYTIYINFKNPYKQTGKVYIKGHYK